MKLDHITITLLHPSHFIIIIIHNMISTNIYVVSVLLAVSFSAILYYNAQAGGGQRHKHYVRVDTDEEVVSPPSTPYADIINPPSPFADDESAPTMIVSPTLPVEEDDHDDMMSWRKRRKERQCHHTG